MARNSNKIMVVKTVENIRTYEFDVPLGTMREYIARLIEQYGEDAWLDGGWHDCWDDTFSYNLRIKREETDEEYATRTTEERQHQLKKEEQEKEQLAKLLAKYGTS